MSLSTFLTDTHYFNDLPPVTNIPGAEGIQAKVWIFMAELGNLKFMITFIDSVSINRVPWCAFETNK